MRRPWMPLFTFLAALLAAAWPGSAFAGQKDAADAPEDEAADARPPGKLSLTLNPGGHTATVTKVFFTPDSREVVTVSADHSVRIWDALSGETVKVLYPPGFGGIGAAALSPDGKTLAVGSRYAEGDKTLSLIYLLSLADGRIEHMLKGHPQPVEAIAFSADGKRLASTSAGPKSVGTVRIWDPATGELEKAFPFVGDPSSLFRGFKRGLAFSPDGTRLARVRLSGGPGDILDLATGKPVVSKLPGVAVAWSPDGKTLATGRTKESGGGVVLFDPGGKQRLRLLDGEGVAGCHSVAFSADSRTLLATWGQVDGLQTVFQTGIFDVSTGKQLVKTKARGAKSGALSPDGQLAATTRTSTTGIHGMTVWKTADGAVVKEVWPTSSIVKASNSTGWSADGKAVGWPGPHGRRSFNLVKLALGPPLAEKDFRGPVHKQGAFSVDRSKLLKDGSALANLKGYCQTLVGADHAASAYMGVISLYEAATGKELRHLRGHHDEVNELVPSPDGHFLLSTSVDQTLKVWNLEQDRALLSLYVQGKDWVAWTEEGYYAATPGGERLMGWKVDNGIDKAASFYPAERFRKLMYRPDLIKLLLEKGSVEAALKAAGDARGEKTRGVTVQELLPPRATLTVLDAKALPQVKVRASAVASVPGQPVTVLRLLIDGRPVPGGAAQADFGAGKGQADAEWTVTLPEGKHTLAVLARSPDASGVSEPQSLTFAVAEKLPVLRVLAVGVNDYQDSSLKLDFAAPDARAIADAFAGAAKGGLFRQADARALLNGQATRANFLKELAELRKRVGPNDLAVVFFAGHGVKEKDQFYLLTVEANTADLAKTTLSGEELRKALGEFPCQVLLLLDACHSSAGVKSFRPAVDEATRSLTEDEVGVAVLCAAMAHEKALEKGGNGLFTRAVVEALGHAEGVPFDRRSRRLYVHHLHTYVLDEVRARSDDQQHPFLNLPWAVESFPVTEFPAGGK